jgi:Macrocin-O-methyltransferase (TylF)
MSSYLISIIRPKDYLHSEAFREIAETVQYGMRGIGHTAAIKENIVDPQVTNILLGAHLLGDGDLKAIPPGTIIFNLEQLGSQHLSESYYRLAENYQIWDYSSRNLERWLQQKCMHVPRLLEIGYVSELRRIVPSPDADIDVLFYGSVNEHRLHILRQLQDAGVRVHAAFGVYGRERDSLIARAKIVLNMHFYETNIFEAVRVSYLLANSKAVVSEEAQDMGYFRDAMAVFPYDKLVTGCLELLRDDTRRRELETRGFECFAARSAAQALSQVLDKSEKRAEVSGEGELRRLYLDMVQRCVLNMIYEDENQDRWSPHRFDVRLRESGQDWPSQAHSMIGNARMTNLRNITELVIRERIPGDFIETGVWRGGACIMMRAVLKAYGAGDRCVWVADSFCGLPKPSRQVASDAGDLHHTFSELAVSLDQVQANFAKYGLLDHQVQFLKGWFSETLPSAPIGQLAILRLDGDMYESTMDALTHLYDKVSEGGFIIVDDFGAVPGCQKAVVDFREQRKINSAIQQIDGYGVFWRKSSGGPAIPGFVLPS